jgi:hypothetical protein
MADAGLVDDAINELLATDPMSSGTWEHMIFNLTQEQRRDDAWRALGVAQGVLTDDFDVAGSAAIAFAAEGWHHDAIRVLQERVLTDAGRRDRWRDIATRIEKEYPMPYTEEERRILTFVRTTRRIHR